MIDLYVFPPSPRAFKVMVIANHLGIDTNIRFLDLVKGEQRHPDYAALNPNMRMPTLKDGDYVLWESCAIAQYLADKKPESGLFAKNERARPTVNPANCRNARFQYGEGVVPAPVMPGVLFSAPKRT